jgi:AraC-like DNA-binding protein
VSAIGSNDHQQCDVEAWDDIVQIEAREAVSAGLKSDGTVVLTGHISDAMKKAEEWEQVISIVLGEGYIAGLMSDKTVAEIADSCGFESQSYFNYSFKKEVGITPGQYRRRTMDSIYY